MNKLNRANFIVAIAFALALIAAIIVSVLYQSAMEWLGLAVVVVNAADLEARLKKAEKLLRDFCKATNPNNAYGWFYDEMRKTTRKEREAAEKFLSPTKRVEPKRDGGTPSMEKQLHDAGFGSFGPL